MLVPVSLLPSTHPPTSRKMFVPSINLPNEIWFYVLKDIVSHEWTRSKEFFPPEDDFKLLAGFKAACRSFYALVEFTREILQSRNMRIPDVAEFMRTNTVLLDRAKHVVVERAMTLADYMRFMPMCENLLSLSLSFSIHQATFLGMQTVLMSHKLVRLDFTYEDVFWRAMRLDFPNLLELRLASHNPMKKRDEAVFIPRRFIGGQRFAAELINSLLKLQRLRYLSVHVSLSSSTSIISENHLDRHKCADTVHFTKCKFCIRSYTTTDGEIVLAREAKLSHMLAEKLPNLERVLWMDAWNERFYDEEAQRESTIIRRPNGKIIVEIGGEKVPMLRKFSLSPC